MTRVKKVVGLPQRYWDKIEQRIDGELIRSYGDALINLLNNTYPDLKIQLVCVSTTTTPPEQHQPPKNEKKEFGF
jgi:hypothetical protein